MIAEIHSADFGLILLRSAGVPAAKNFAALDDVGAVGHA